MNVTFLDSCYWPRHCIITSTSMSECFYKKAHSDGCWCTEVATLNPMTEHTSGGTAIKNTRQDDKLKGSVPRNHCLPITAYIHTYSIASGMSAATTGHDIRFLPNRRKQQKSPKTPFILYHIAPLFGWSMLTHFVLPLLSSRECHGKHSEGASRATYIRTYIRTYKLHSGASL